jgi:threonine-phosphate decarboxylase
VRRAHGGSCDPGVLDFSANLNPLGPPRAVRELLAGDLLAAAGRYPSADARELCAAIARHHGVPRESVIAGNGASELLYLIARCFAGRRAFVQVPAFTEYEDACLAHGVELVSDPRAADAVFLGNPASPGGELVAAGEWVETPGTLIVDESFMGFTDERESLVRRAARDPRCIAVRSLTKLYAIAGLRAGYAIADPDRVRELRAVQPPWSVNQIAAEASIAALADRAYLDETRLRVAELRTELAAGLALLGLEPSRSATNYLRCSVPDAAALCTELLRRGIAARDCSSFSGLAPNRHVRFAVRGRADNERLLAARAELAAPGAQPPQRAVGRDAEVTHGRV